MVLLDVWEATSSRFSFRVLIHRMHLPARLEQVLGQVKSIKTAIKAPSNVTCSIGVTFCDDKRSIEEIYKNADDALYRAKQNGKNQITFF